VSLGDSYKIIDTGEPEQALALALEHKPDAILLDLRMPKYSGYELCQTFTSFSSTQLIPVLVISGKPATRLNNFAGIWERWLILKSLWILTPFGTQLSEFLQIRRKERRSEVRVRLRIPLRITGTDQDGRPFGVLTTTENVSRSAFLCACSGRNAGAVRRRCLHGT